MQKNIHPEYFQCAVRCTCGNEFTVGATRPDMRVEVCSKCHPFYTGTARLIDSTGRAEKFSNWMQQSSQQAASSKKQPRTLKGKK